MLLLTRSQESSFTWWVLLCCNSSQTGHLTIKYQKSKTASTSLQRFASAARAKELTYVSFQIDTEQIFVYLKEMRRMANGTQATLLMHIVTVNLATTHHLVEHVSSYISQEISCGHSATATICKSRRVVMWSPLNNIWTLCASSLIMPSAKKKKMHTPSLDFEFCDIMIKPPNTLPTLTMWVWLERLVRKQYAARAFRRTARSWSISIIILLCATNSSVTWSSRVTRTAAQCGICSTSIQCNRLQLMWMRQ